MEELRGNELSVVDENTAPVPEVPEEDPGDALKRLVREHTDGGRMLVSFFLEVLNDPKTPVKHRIEAAKWLADRGFGRVRDEEPAIVALKIDIGDFHVPGIVRE